MTASFLELVDLAAERFGGSVVAANDEFFAEKENLIRRSPPEWRESAYTDRGKWMDGWETRRRRDLGPGAHDWCIIRLGARGIVRGVDVETTFFKGNYPESCALDVCDAGQAATREALTSAAWREVIARTTLVGDAHNLFPVADAPAAAYVRLRIFPDGGVARLRVHGEVVADWTRLRQRGEVDLAAAEHGAVVVSCSDMFFGSRHNLIMPGDALSMAEGWETRRRRGPGHDWTIVRLAAPGVIRRIEVDTRHFKGNAPGACSVEGSADEAAWQDVLPRAALQPHARNVWEPVVPHAAIAYARLNIYPDGGVARLRLWGTPS
jgi:allantoicase